jgi:hypothetical protein
MTEIDVCLVKHGNLPVPNVGADFASPFVVVLLRGVDDCKTRQEAMEVQAKMAFSRGFATPMFGPVQAVGDQWS